jgi:hypothetical protein
MSTLFKRTQQTTYGLINKDDDEDNKVLLATCIHAGFLLGLFFDPEDGSDMLLRNVDFQRTT